MRKSTFTFALLLLLTVLTLTAFPQSINNTVGTSGIFSIKDASSTYFTLSQSTGQVNILKTLRLEPSTNSTTGIIFKGANRFLYDYGTNNIFMGINSGNFTLTGSNNVAIGYSSLSLNSTGYSNTSLGSFSLSSNSTGYQNTALGYNTLSLNSGGFHNTAIGCLSMLVNNTGSENTSVGYYALNSNTTGVNNTSVGSQSLVLNTVGIKNTAIGFQALYNNTTGNYNIGIGHEAGINLSTGSNNINIGYFSMSSIGSVSNEITLGNTSHTVLRCNVTSITSLSDQRDKKNISDLSLGLDFIMKLKPRQFNWDKREWYDDEKSDGSKMLENPTAGFIAQELDDVQIKENAEWLNLVLKSNPDKLEATYGNLLPVIVKAVQELKDENDKLMKQNQIVADKYDEIKSENDNLKKEIERLNTLNSKMDKLEKVINQLQNGDTHINNVKLSETNR